MIRMSSVLLEIDDSDVRQFLATGTLAIVARTLDDNAAFGPSRLVVKCDISVECIIVHWFGEHDCLAVILGMQMRVGGVYVLGDW